MFNFNDTVSMSTSDGRIVGNIGDNNVISSIDVNDGITSINVYDNYEDEHINNPRKKKVVKLDSKELILQKLDKIKCTEAKENEDKECSICMKNEKNVLLQPCGHFHYCAECLKTVIKDKTICPFCRDPINDVNIVYQ